MTDELEVLAIVTGRLEAQGIAYMITGSVAANYYGVPRMTRDIDIVVELSSAHVDAMLALFGADFYIDADALRAAVADRSTVNLIHQGRMLKVDLIVRRGGEYRVVEFARRRRAAVGGLEVSIVAPEDLIISKLDWARDTRSAIQLADVRNVLRSVPDLDEGYLTRWTDRLGLAAAYREARE